MQKRQKMNNYLSIKYSIVSNKSLSKIQGIGYRTKRGKIKINANSQFINNLDTIPFPARNLLPMEKYRSVVSSKFTTLIAMRGCYAKCNYCSVPFFSGTTIRRRSPKNIIQEMSECFNKYGTKHFSFLDDTFTTDKIWVHKFCNELKQSKLNKKISETPGHKEFLLLSFDVNLFI